MSLSADIDISHAVKEVSKQRHEHDDDAQTHRDIAAESGDVRVLRFRLTVLWRGVFEEGQQSQHGKLFRVARAQKETVLHCELSNQRE